LIYWTWYHFWKTKSEILYYNTSIVSPWELVQKFSFVLEGLWNHIVRNQFHFIGFFAFLYVLIRERIMGIRFKNAELGPFSKDPWTLLKQRFFLLAIFSLVFILLFKGTHFVNHGYYLLAHFIFFLFFIFCMVQILPRKIRSVFLFVYALIGVTNTYYLFDPSSLKEKKTIESLLIRNDVKPQEKIAAYLGEESNTTYYLYYAKRMGWALPASKSNELCPQGAAWKLYEKDGILALESCGNPARDSL
jgi:hypothetical protein